MPRLWVDRVISQQVATGAEAVINLLSEVSIAESRLGQFTLLRTIIGLDIARLTHDSGEGSDQMAMGIGIVSQEALSIGTTAIPNASIGTDHPARGWIWRAIYRTYGFAADQPAAFNRRIDLDLRSQRKLDNGVSVLIMENDAVEGSTSVTLVLGLIRQLWLVG